MEASDSTLVSFSVKRLRTVCTRRCTCPSLPQTGKLKMHRTDWTSCAWSNPIRISMGHVARINLIGAQLAMSVLARSIPMPHHLVWVIPLTLGGVE